MLRARLIRIIIILAGVKLADGWRTGESWRLTFLRLFRFRNRLETKMCVSVFGRVVDTPAAEPSLFETRWPQQSGSGGDFDMRSGKGDRSAEHQPHGGRHLALLGDAITVMPASFSRDGRFFKTLKSVSQPTHIRLVLSDSPKCGSGIIVAVATGSAVQTKVRISKEEEL